MLGKGADQADYSGLKRKRDDPEDAETPAHARISVNHATGAEGLEPPTYGFGDRRSTN